MKKRPGFKAMAIVADEEDAEVAFKSSLSVTAGGSLQVRDFHINKLGMSSGITLEDIDFGQELGRGASSVVYKSTHRPTGQIVACKMLTNVWDKELRKQLVAEMQFLKPKLKESPCPFLIQIYDAYFSDDKTYIILEFCGHGALDDCLKKYGPMPEPALSVCMRQIFLGLCYLYTNAIVHRDMKPANCLVDDNGIVKISDFGSSKDCSGNNLQSPAHIAGGDGAAAPDGNATTFTGTTRYMSPERLNGQPYSWPADVWCAGMIMLELGMGDHPYKVAFGEDGSFMALIEYANKRETPELPPEYSQNARDFANLCMLKDPSQRPRPTVMVNEGDPDSSHPFITDHAPCGPEEVLGWLKAR